MFFPSKPLAILSIMFLATGKMAHASVQFRTFGGFNLVNWDALVGAQNKMNNALGEQSIQQVYLDVIYGIDGILTFSPDSVGWGLGLRSDTQTIKTSTSDRSFEFSAARTAGLLRHFWGKNFRWGLVGTMGINHYSWQKLTSKAVVTEYRGSSANSWSFGWGIEGGPGNILFFLEGGYVLYSASGFYSSDGQSSNINLVANGIYTVGGIGVAF